MAVLQSDYPGAHVQSVVAAPGVLHHSLRFRHHYERNVQFLQGVRFTILTSILAVIVIIAIPAK